MKKKSPKTLRIKNSLEAKALRFLSYKPRTSFEIESLAKRYLKKCSLSLEEEGSLVKELISGLEKLGYIDDEDYVHSYISEQQDHPLPRGPKYISGFLYKKGISSDLIKFSLDEYFREEMEVVCIKRLLAKTKKDSPRKLINYLMRRGFSAHLIFGLVDSERKNH